MAAKNKFDGTRIIDSEVIKRVKDMGATINAVETAFRAYESGDAIMPPKSYVSLDEIDGDFRSMPAKVGNGAGIKWVNVHPGNPDSFGLPTVMGLVIYSDPESAYPLAVLDGTELTRLRTGAAAGVATDYLANSDAQSFGVVGAGEQAKTQLAAISEVRDLKEVVVTDIDETAVDEFLDHATTAEFEVRKGTPKDVAECDIISTTTPSREPILQSELIAPGTHINAMGADAAGKQELDSEILEDAAVVIDDWEQCAHSGEINVPVTNSLFTQEDVAAEIGSVVTGQEQHLDKQTTVFDSTGLAIQDIATASQLYDSAKQNNEGELIDIIGTA